MAEIIDGKSVWKGAIIFGMVTLPISLRSTDNDKSPEFHTYHRKDMAPVKYKKVCSKDGAELAEADIIKGIDVGDRIIPFEPEEIASLKVASNKAVQIDKFVDRTAFMEKAISHLNTSYIVVPDTAATGPYGILEEALRLSNKVGIGRFTLRDRERPVVIQSHDGAIIITTMAYDDEIIRPENISGLQGITAPPEEAVSLAIALIEGMSEDFDLSEYHNTKVVKFEEMLEAKLNGKKVKIVPVAAAAIAPQQDIVAVLKASIDAKKKAGKIEKPKTTGKKVVTVRSR